MREIFNLFSDAPWLTRLHLKIRWMTCPFPKISQFVPKKGRILEIGCGHGLFSLYLAREASARKVVGVDIDPKKITWAKRAAVKAKSLGVEFSAVPPNFLPRGKWDGIVVVDVLYLLDAASQKRLLLSCAKSLNPKGILVVKEMAPAPRWKFLWNKIQESISVRILRITRGQKRFTFTLPEVLVKWLEEEGLVATQYPLDQGYPHPHHLVIGRRS